MKAILQSTPIGATSGAARSTLPVPAALAILALTILSGAALRVVFSPIQEVVRAALHLSDFEVSLVQGLAASIPIAALSIPLGRLVDRANRVRILMVMSAVSIVGSLLTAAAHAFWLLFIARMLAGLGATLSIPVAISITADLSSIAQRGRSILYLAIGNMVGMALAFAAGGWLFGHLSSGAILLPGQMEPWRAVFLVFGAVALLALLPLAVMREPERHETADAVGAPFRVAMAALWARRRLLLPLFIAQVTVVMADTAAAIWAAPVLTRRFGLQPADFSGWMGLVILLSGILGPLIGGFAADAGHKSHIKGGLLAGAVVAALLSIPTALYPVMPSVGGFALALALFLVCGSCIGLITSTAIAVLVPNELRGVAAGAFMVLGGVIAFGVAPSLVSLLSTALGGDSHLGTALAILGVTTSAITLAGFVQAARSLGRGRGA